MVSVLTAAWVVAVVRYLGSSLVTIWKDVLSWEVRPHLDLVG